MSYHMIDMRGSKHTLMGSIHTLSSRGEVRTQGFVQVYLVTTPASTVVGPSSVKETTHDIAASAAVPESTQQTSHPCHLFQGLPQDTAIIANTMHSFKVQGSRFKVHV